MLLRIISESLLILAATTRLHYSVFTTSFIDREFYGQSCSLIAERE